jgi:hypothetical protein
MPAEIWDKSQGAHGIADLQIEKLLSPDLNDSTAEKDTMHVFQLMILNTEFSLWQTFLFSERHLTASHVELSRGNFSNTNKRQHDLPLSFVVPDEMKLDQFALDKRNVTTRRIPGVDKFVVRSVKRRDEEYRRPTMRMRDAYNQLSDLRLPVSSVLIAPDQEFEDSRRIKDIKSWIQNAIFIWKQEYDHQTVGKTLYDDNI